MDHGWFTEIKYTDLDGDAAKEEVDKLNEKGKKALPPPDKRRRYDDRRGGGKHLNFFPLPKIGV